MHWPVQCGAVIPCLNEEKSIARVVSGVRRHLPAVIVIDDGSTDATGREAQSAGAEVLRNPVPQGKGAALVRGWTHALERGLAWAVTLDGDGQHSPDDIPHLLGCAERTGASLVVGNRMGSTRDMPWLRLAVNRWMSSRISRLANRSFPDTQCGFRLMDLVAWRGLPVSASHFEIESEVLVAFARAGLRIEFVPVQSIYEEEQSKIHPWRDTLRWWRWWREQSRR
jgi:glycosyltransferase involved in cell wall biosynthesis